MSAASIITYLMRRVEILCEENACLVIKLREYEAEPQSPFTLLSSEDVLAILHPRDAHQGRLYAGARR